MAGNTTHSIKKVLLPDGIYKGNFSGYVCTVTIKRPSEFSVHPSHKQTIDIETRDGIRGFAYGVTVTVKNGHATIEF